MYTGNKLKLQNKRKQGSYYQTTSLEFNLQQMLPLNILHYKNRFYYKDKLVKENDSCLS